MPENNGSRPENYLALHFLPRRGFPRTGRSNVKGRLPGGEPGFESGCEDILLGINKHSGVEKIREASRLLAEFGIQRMGFLLLGGPGETRASVEESLPFADSLNLDALKLTPGIRIYPQTKLAWRAVEEGLIARGDPLLLPRFYLVEELRGWLRDTVDRWAKGRFNCLFLISSGRIPRKLASVRKG